MEIVSIFGNNLFAFKYLDEAEDEFSRLFDLWNDPEYLKEKLSEPLIKCD